jgi:prophage regulatory protein
MRVLRIDDVMQRTGLSRPTIWRRERLGAFPRRRKLGGNAVGWLEHEVDQWIESLPPSETIRQSESEMT